jgi:uncharacterized membrane protein YphA (DoxX/SURF4 family)
VTINEQLQIRQKKSLSACEVVRGLLAITFFVSGTAKAVSPEAAANLISSSVGLPHVLAHAFVYVVSVFELVLGLLLVVNRLTTLASFCSTFFFLSAIIIGLHFLDQPIDCGCFGNLVSTRTDASFLVRNIMFLICSMFLLRRSTPGPGRKNRYGREFES